MTYFHAKRPDIKTMNWLGRIYHRHKVFLTPQAANALIRAFQEDRKTLYRRYRTLALYVNLGEGAGKLRYAVFVCKSANLFHRRT